MQLGLDIGTNSIGWWLYKSDNNGEPIAHITGGVRIFSDGRDPKSKASLAVARRDARAARRRRDRFLRRKTALIGALVEYGLLPKDENERQNLIGLDPYELRARGIEAALTPYELGRALFHLNQRRGFKSNRKADAKSNEGGKVKEGAARLDQVMMEKNVSTLGGLVVQMRSEAPDDRHISSVRARLGSYGKNEYLYYPTRQMIEDEFKRLWDVQSAFNPELLSDEAYEAIHRVIFYQRPLKAPKVGLCFFEDETRIPKAHPLFQERRIYQTANELMIVTEGQGKRPLTEDERNQVVMILQGAKTVGFSTVEKGLKLRSDQRFSHDAGSRNKLEGDELRVEMKKAYGEHWSALSWQNQWAIIKPLIEEPDPEKLRDQLRELGLNTEQIEALQIVKLPDGYGRLGETASRRILEIMKRGVISYSDAAIEAYGTHSDDATGEVLDELPYYGEILQRHVIPGSHDASLHDPERDAAEYWGRITNPTVHIGLNQLRKLVNEIINIYGLPDKIVVELARDLKNSKKQKDEIIKQIKENTNAAIKRSEKLSEWGIKDTGNARLRLKLWEQSHEDAMKRCCPYCTKKIGQAALFDGSTDIDHILPYSKTLDDSIANKVICCAECNRDKRNRTPAGAWFHNEERWEKITSNLKNLPKSKRWRFQPDALEKFEDSEQFLDRQLTDTQYLSRIAKAYLERLYPDPKVKPVQVIPGRLTEMLRRKWRLNDLLADSNHYETAKEKNRQDHRHHAIDAAVIGVTGLGLIQKIQKAAGRGEELGLDKLENFDFPWPNFKIEMKAILDAITVSHKTDHGTVGRGSTSGQLHNETAYGRVEGGYVVTRKPYNGLQPKDIEKIRDPELKDLLWQRTQGLTGKAFSEELEKFANLSGPYQNIRRVRIIEKLDTIPIMNDQGQIYKGYKGDSNHCVEIWKMPDGKWSPQVLTTFDANRQGLGASRPHPAAKLVARVFKNDAVALERDKIGFSQGIVAKISPQNGLYLYPANEANVDARSRDKNDPFKYLQVGLGRLQGFNFRKIGVDILGRVKDLGPYKS